MSKYNWKRPRPAAIACDVSVPVVKRLMKQGVVSVRHLPGGRPEVDVLELQRVIRNSITAAATVG